MNKSQRVDPFVSNEPEVEVDATTNRILKQRMNCGRRPAGRPQSSPRANPATAFKVLSVSRNISSVIF